MTDKLYPDADSAIADVFDGAAIMFGGFASAGSPETLIRTLIKGGPTNLTAIANSVGYNSLLDRLCEQRRLSKAIVSFAIRASPALTSHFEAQYRAGEVELEMVPQGTLAERIRCGGAGIAAFCTRTGVGTVAAEGKQTIELDGKVHLLERALRADFAFIRAHKADTMGNLIYRRASRNFNNIMATAADVVIAEVDEIVPAGEIEPEAVVTNGIFVDRIIVGARRGSPWAK